MDMTLIGETTAKLMDVLPDEIPEDAEASVVAVGLVVVIADGKNEGGTYTRVKCSDDSYYIRLGLFHAALDVITTGDAPGWKDYEEEDG